MWRFSIVLICLLLIPVRTEAFSQEKIYKPVILNNSLNNEKYYKLTSDTNKDEETGLYSEKYLKKQSDFYCAKQDFVNAVKIYETLVKDYPKLCYKVVLANLYMVNKDFAKAETLLEPLYNANPDIPVITEAYLNSLYAQQKTAKAYWVVKKCHLEDSKEGCIVLADMAMKDQDYASAAKNYFKALQFEPENINLKNNLARCYRLLGHISAPEKLYKEVLSKDSGNLEAKTGLGYLEINKKNFKNARKIFNDILSENPCNKKALKGIIQSYLANGDNLKALEILKQMPQDEDIGIIMAQTYYKMGMYSSAMNSIPYQAEEKEIENKPKEQTSEANNIYKSSETESNEKTDSIERFSDDSIEDINPLSNKNKIDIDSEIYGTMPSDYDFYTIPGLPEHKYSMGMESPRILQAGVHDDIQNLRYKIKRSEAFNIIPTYSFLFQQLEDQFDLDYHKFGLQVSKNDNKNTKAFFEYNIYIYNSGGINKLYNVTNEFFGGIQSRPVEKWEYSANFGAKVFEFDRGGMIITDSWIKHYFNDTFNLKLGFRRNNIEQSYLSAVGAPINEIFTGRAADNKFYLEFERKFPRGFYAFGRGSYGVIYAQNLVTNQYGEGMAGLGKLLYSNPKNPWINTFAVDLVSSNTAYQYNLSSVYDNAGHVFGGYFSPSYFNATTVNLKLEGYIKKLGLNYGIKGFGGIQIAMAPDSITPAWGILPYISYDLNSHISFNLSYSFYNYARVQRNMFIFNAVFRIFRNNLKK